MTVFEWIIALVFGGAIGLGWWEFQAWNTRSALDKWDKKREQAEASEHHPSEKPK